MLCHGSSLQTNVVVNSEFKASVSTLLYESPVESTEATSASRRV